MAESLGPKRQTRASVPLNSCVTLGKLLSLYEQVEWTIAIVLVQAPGCPFLLTCGQMALSQWREARAVEATEGHSEAQASMIYQLL